MHSNGKFETCWTRFLNGFEKIKRKAGAPLSTGPGEYGQPGDRGAGAQRSLLPPRDWGDRGTAVDPQGKHLWPRHKVGRHPQNDASLATHALFCYIACVPS